MKRYLIIYTLKSVIDVIDYYPGINVATSAAYIVDTMANAKVMLEAIGVDITTLINFTTSKP